MIDGIRQADKVIQSPLISNLYNVDSFHLLNVILINRVQN
jgi:hypothetical protein